MNILNLVIITHFFLNVGIIHEYLKIANLKVTRKIWWGLLALAFFLALFVRVYNYITIQQIIEMGFFSLGVFVKIWIPLCTNILIYVALRGIGGDIKSLYKKWL